jgi:hypothetical protein
VKYEVFDRRKGVVVLSTPEPRFAVTRVRNAPARFLIYGVEHVTVQVKGVRMAGRALVDEYHVSEAGELVPRRTFLDADGVDSEPRLPFLLTEERA